MHYFLTEKYKEETLEDDLDEDALRLVDAFCDLMQNVWLVRRTAKDSHEGVIARRTREHVILNIFGMNLKRTMRNLTTTISMIQQNWPRQCWRA